MATLNWQDWAAIATILSIGSTGLFALGGWTLNWLTDCVGKRLEAVVNGAENRIIARIEEKIEPLEKAKEEHDRDIVKLQSDVKWLLRGGKVNGAAFGE